MKDDKAKTTKTMAIDKKKRKKLRESNRGSLALKPNSIISPQKINIYIVKLLHRIKFIKDEL